VTGLLDLLHDLARLVAEDAFRGRHEPVHEVAAVGGASRSRGRTAVPDGHHEAPRDQLAQGLGEVGDHRAAVLELFDRRAAVDQDQRVAKRAREVVSSQRLRALGVLPG
jgi:hypothetical protein